ncbi:MAG: phosphotransferase [Paracoccaceae bacterium]
MSEQARIAALAATGALPAGLVLDHRLTARRGQSVFAAQFNGAAAIVKTYAGDGAEGRTAAAAAALKAAAQRMTDPAFRVPKLLWAAPEHRLVVMAQEGGVPMDRLFAAEPALAERNRLLTRAALWLQAFCEGHNTAPHFFPMGWIDRAVNGHDIATLPADAARLHAALRNQMAKVRGKEFLRGGLHGDFVPGNLLVDGDAICGMDIQGSFTLPLLRELATFLVWMTFKTPQAALTHGIGRQDAAAICTALNIGPDARPILWFFVGEQLLRRRLDTADKPCPTVLAIMIDNYLAKLGAP